MLGKPIEVRGNVTSDEYGLMMIVSEAELEGPGGQDRGRRPPCRAGGDAMISREVAWRVFAGEYNSSNLEIKGEGERAPSYIVTPLGAMINRVLPGRGPHGPGQHRHRRRSRCGAPDCPTPPGRSTCHRDSISLKRPPRCRRSSRPRSSRWSGRRAPIRPRRGRCTSPSGRRR